MSARLRWALDRAHRRFSQAVDLRKHFVSVRMSPSSRRPMSRAAVFRRCTLFSRAMRSSSTSGSSNSTRGIVCGLPVLARRVAYSSTAISPRLPVGGTSPRARRDRKPSPTNVSTIRMLFGLPSHQRRRAPFLSFCGLCNSSTTTSTMSIGTANIDRTSRRSTLPRVMSGLASGTTILMETLFRAILHAHITGTDHLRLAVRAANDVRLLSLGLTAHGRFDVFAASS